MFEVDDCPSLNEPFLVASEAFFIPLHVLGVPIALPTVFSARFSCKFGIDCGEELTDLKGDC